MTYRFRLFVLLASGAGAFAPLPVKAQTEDSQTTKVFTIDVALDGKTNAQIDVNPNDPNEMDMGFARGDVGVVDGSMYRANTLQTGTQDNDPENPAGRIGKIVCRAAYIINFSEAMNGAPYASFISELYVFDDEQHSTLIADGYGPTTGHSVYRTVTGGTGRFRNMTGQMFEENLGVNATMFCNLRMRFELRTAGRDRQ